ncbi:MAG: CoA protein activase, partial [Nitrospirae bacterium]
MAEFFGGIDGGSVSIKLAILDSEGNLIDAIYRRHHGHPIETAIGVLEEAFSKYGAFKVAFTGATGKAIASLVDAPYFNELVSLQKGIHAVGPQVRTVIEMGGEDSKLLILDNDSIRDFALNSVCAAGTGSFLDQQAERLKLTIEEFAEMGLRSKNPPRIAGRCSVFAKSDMIHLQQIATPVEDIVAGLCFAVARNFKGTIVRGRPLPEKVAFCGGVAMNRAVVRAFKEVFGFEELLIPKENPFVGALGVALKAKQDGLLAEVDIERLKERFKQGRTKEKGHPPLLSEGDDFAERHLNRND